MVKTSVESYRHVTTLEGMGKKPNRTGKATMAYLNQEVRAALDAYIAGQEFEPTLTTIMELAIKEFLAKRGAWPRPAQVPPEAKPPKPRRKPPS